MGLCQSEKTLGCLVLPAEIVPGHASQVNQKVNWGRTLESVNGGIFSKT